MRIHALVVLAASLVSTSAWAQDITVKLSLSIPTSNNNDPSYNAFSPSQFAGYGSSVFDPKQGTLERRTIRADSTSAGRPWGVHMSFYDQAFTKGFAVDLAWIKNREGNMEVKSQIDRWAHGAFADTTTQITEHSIDLHTFRLGFRYDFLYDNKYVSLEPGLGWEISAASHTYRSTTTRIQVSPGPPETIQTSKGSKWQVNFEPALYISLNGQVYPLGKDRILGIGLSTRYLPKPPVWGFLSDSLLGSYSLPIRHRQWSTSLYATLAF